MRAAVYALVAIALLGCVTYKQMQDYDDFQALCEREAGLHVYRKVKADEIFYDADACGTLCAITLIDSKALQRIGFCSTKQFGPFPDRKPAGCYVFEKGIKGDAACYNELDGAFRSHRDKTFFDNQCVKILPMGEKFRYRSNSSIAVDIVDEDIKSAVISSRTEIYDSYDGSVIFRLNHFNFVAKNYSNKRENYTKRCKNAYSNKNGGVRSASLIDMVFE